MRAGKCTEAHPNVAQRRRDSKAESTSVLLPGIVKGEKVLLYDPKAEKKRIRKARELERDIQRRCIVALGAADFLVYPHVAQMCWKCKAPPVKQTGLGEGMSDILCIARNGRAIFIEMKVPGYSPSDVREKQRERLAIVRQWNAISGIATSEAEALAIAQQAYTCP